MLLLLVLISDLRDRIEVVVGGASNALCIGIQLAMCQFQNQQFALSLYGLICRTYGSIHCVQGPSMVLIIDLQSYYNHPKHFCHNPRVIYTDKRYCKYTFRDIYGTPSSLAHRETYTTWPRVSYFLQVF